MLPTAFHAYSVPMARPVWADRSIANFATMGLIVPSTVAGNRNAHAVCSKMRIGHDSPIRKAEAPAQAFSHKIAMHAAALAKNIPEIRFGKFGAESAMRPPR